MLVGFLAPPGLPQVLMSKLKTHWLLSKDIGFVLAKPVFGMEISIKPSWKKFQKKLKNYVAIFRGKRYNSLNKGLWQENGLVPV